MRAALKSIRRQRGGGNGAIVDNSVEMVLDATTVSLRDKALASPEHNSTFSKIEPGKLNKSIPTLLGVA